jgi:retron-type reverse transcriptase
MNTVIKITKLFKTREDFKEISQGVRQGCPMSPTLCNLYFDEVVRKWQSQLKTNYFIGDITLNALLFADDQIVLADSKENLQRAVFSLNNCKRI